MTILTLINLEIVEDEEDLKDMWMMKKY